MGVLLATYFASLMLRDPDQSWEWVDSWSTTGFEIVGSALCIARGFTRRSGRAVALTLGLGLLMWSLGDLTYTIQSHGGTEPSTPSWADAFFLLFYPFTYVAVVIFMRGEVRRLATPSWLDGAVAGLGASAACSAFAFYKVVHVTGGEHLETITNLAYPIADLLLLSLVVGGSALMAGRRKAPWILMATGITINVGGDTANLVQSSLGAAQLSSIVDGIA
jgi:hypothetical protein